MRTSRAKIGQLEKGSTGSFRSFWKKLKNRWERRKAKANPEVLPTYKRYEGYE